MFWLGCYSCSCCDGNRIKSTPCSQTWTRTRTKQQFFYYFPTLTPNDWNQKIKLFVASPRTIRKKVPQLLLCIILTRIFYRFLFPNHHCLGIIRRRCMRYRLKISYIPGLKNSINKIKITSEYVWYKNYLLLIAQWVPKMMMPPVSIESYKDNLKWRQPQMKTTSPDTKCRQL